ncbi:unnamed protein product, partial [Didymodactylos carnosus]
LTKSFAYVKYEGSPLNPEAVFRGQITFTCLATGGDGKFKKWCQDGIGEEDYCAGKDKKDFQGHYDVKASPEKSVLTIKVVIDDDFAVKGWYVLTENEMESKPEKCHFGQIRKIPSPVYMQTSKNEVVEKTYGSITRVADEPLHLTCITNPPNQAVKWSYSLDNKVYNQLPKTGFQNDENNLNTLAIANVGKEHRGFYRCSINNASFTTKLRVKDKLAALWPFIGILVVVLLLVIVILIFERREKSKRKEEDDHDHADDP